MKLVTLQGNGHAEDKVIGVPKAAQGLQGEDQTPCPIASESFLPSYDKPSPPGILTILQGQDQCV